MTAEMKPLDLDELDEILDELPGEYVPGMYAHLIGKKVDWHHTGWIGELVELKKGGLRIKIDLKCHCGKESVLVYLGEGLHRGAWCYVFSEQGEYLANLRDQEYFCDECNPKQKQKKKEN